MAIRDFSGIVLDTPIESVQADKVEELASDLTGEAPAAAEPTPTLAPDFSEFQAGETSAGAPDFSEFVGEGGPKPSALTELTPEMKGVNQGLIRPEVLGISRKFDVPAADISTGSDKFKEILRRNIEEQEPAFFDSVQETAGELFPVESPSATLAQITTGLTTILPLAKENEKLRQKLLSKATTQEQVDLINRGQLSPDDMLDFPDPLELAGDMLILGSEVFGETILKGLGMGARRVLMAIAPKATKRLMTSAGRALFKDITPFLRKATKPRKTPFVDNTDGVLSGIIKKKGRLTQPAGMSKKTVATKPLVKPTTVTGLSDDISAKVGKGEALTPSETVRLEREFEERLSKETAPTIRERLAGVRPDIKKRIAGKTDLFDEYIDVQKIRNLNDEKLSPLGHAAEKVNEARDSLRKLLRAKGKELGKVRKKVGSVKADSADIDNVVDSFTEQLDSSGLRIKNGKVVKLTARETPMSDTEITFLQDTYDKLVRLKQDPRVQRIVDVKKAIDETLNFKKAQREISGNVDAFGKRLRTGLSKVEKKIIGKSGEELTGEVAELNKLVDDLEKATSKGVNPEFVLKRVLSERDRVPKAILKRVAEITGIDLMDEARMAQLATELIGNSESKGLLRQEIQKSGLDILSVLNPKASAITTLLEKGYGVFEDPVKVFRGATKLK